MLAAREQASAKASRCSWGSGRRQRLSRVTPEETHPREMLRPGRCLQAPTRLQRMTLARLQPSSFATQMIEFPRVHGVGISGVYRLPMGLEYSHWLHEGVSCQSEGQGGDEVSRHRLPALAGDGAPATRASVRARRPTIPEGLGMPNAAGGEEGRSAPVFSPAGRGIHPAGHEVSVGAGLIVQDQGREGGVIGRGGLASEPTRCPHR